jgi:excisionase family DNA binding protein
MITPSEAAAMAGVTVRTINRWVEAERLHFAETGDGLLLICPNSVPQL